MGTGKSRVKDTPAENAAPDDIQSDIEQTRKRMDRTIEELGERLQSFRSVDDAMDFINYVKEHTSEEDTEAMLHTGRQVLRRVRENPIPSALIAAGAAWMVLRGEKKEPSPPGRAPAEAVPGFEYREGVSPPAEEEAFEFDRRLTEAKEKGAKESAWAPGPAKAGAEVGNDSGESGESLLGTIRKNPFAVGAGAIAFGVLGGALCAFALPYARRKDLPSGPEAEQRSEKVRETAMEGAGKNIRKPEEAAAAAAKARKDALEGAEKKYSEAENFAPQEEELRHRRETQP